MSSPASARPKGLPLRSTISLRWSLPSRHQSPSASGVTNTGEKALAGLDWKKPKPLASSPGIRLRSDTSLVRPTSRTAASASSRDRAQRHVAGDHHHFGLEVAAPALVGERDRVARAQEAVRCRPGTSADRARSSRASRRRAPAAPARHGSHRPSRRPIDTRAAAAPRPRARGSARAGSSHARDRSARLRRSPSTRSQSSSAACSVGAIVLGVGVPGEIVRYDDQLAVTAMLEAGQFHSFSSSLPTLSAAAQPRNAS